MGWAKKLMLLLLLLIILRHVECDDWEEEDRKCANATGCVDCLVTLTDFGYECAYTNGECILGGVDGGYAAMLPRDFGDEGIETLAQARCDAYQVIVENEAVCRSISACAECISTELPASQGLCQWYEFEDRRAAWCASENPHSTPLPATTCSSTGQNSGNLLLISWCMIPLLAVPFW